MLPPAFTGEGRGRGLRQPGPFPGPGGHCAGGTVVELSRTRPRIYTLLVLVGVLVPASGLRAQNRPPGAPEDPLRWSHNVPGDSKPLLLHGDAIATWTENGRRVFLLRGNVLVEQGVVHLRMQQGVVW